MPSRRAGLGGSSHTAAQAAPSNGSTTSIVKFHVFIPKPPLLTRACQMVQQDSESLRQHEKRRGRLKGMPMLAEKDAGRPPQ